MKQEPVDNFDLSLNITQLESAENCGFMSVDQCRMRQLLTFHTPSFGDEEFEIPALNFVHNTTGGRCGTQGSFTNQVLNYPRSSPINQQQQQQHPSCQQQNHHLFGPPQSQQTIVMSNGHYHNAPSPVQQSRGSPQQNMYQNEMMVPHSINIQMQQPYDGCGAYSNNRVHQGNMQPSQMHIIHQQHHQQQMGNMGPPQQQQQQQVFSTISQTQLSNQLGLHIGMGGHPTHNQGTPSSNGTPPGSNHNSPCRETSEDSDDSTPLAQLIGGMKRPSPEPVDVAPKVTKKPKAQKKKKKKDPNEPQKPVSAYALFFRDTQAAIKGQSPNASFGEVSKIVASMWDALEVDAKNVYKKKTETAKKEYLKALAAYRATLVSKQSPPHMMNSNSPPHMMSGNNMVNMQSMQAQQQQQQQSPPHQMTMNRPLQPQQQQQMSSVPQSLCHPAGESPTYQQQNMSPVSIGGAHPNVGGPDVMPPIQTCLRNGCPNLAVDSPDWDREYCSSECVVSHCRDVFTAWVASRQVNPAYSTVK